MSSVQQLKHELNDLSSAMSNAKAAAADLESKLAQTIDPAEAERLAVAHNAQTTVAANLAKRITDTQGAIAAAEKEAARVRYETLKEAQRAAAADALQATNAALASMADAFAMHNDLANAHHLAHGWPWSGANEWNQSRGDLERAATVLERLAGV